MKETGRIVKNLEQIVRGAGVSGGTMRKKRLNREGLSYIYILIVARLSHWIFEAS